MRYAYPCELHAEDDGGYYVTFPDIPEALTGGASEAETLDLAAEALGTALAGYALAKRAIPKPSPPARGQRLVAVPPVVAAKLALIAAMRADRITNVELARRLNLSEGAVRKLVDPDHASRIDKLQDALKAVGRGLIIEDVAA